MKNLIIATTPLQAKIAKHIQKLYPKEAFISLYITPVMNERQEYYSRDFDHVYCLRTAEELAQICLNLSGTYDKIFYASFDHPLILDLVANSHYQHLMSFDDGYADIYPNSIYAKPLNKLQIGSLGLTRDDLIRRTERHYTLYKSDYHVVDKEKLIYLDHFFTIDTEPVQNGKHIKILLGQNFSEEDENISIRFITAYANALKIDYYIPHPKERFKLENIPYFETPLIFEDALSLLFKDYEFIEVYHFTSSVSLHLKDVKNVSVKGISVFIYNDRQKELRKLGCEFITVPLGWNM